jgi:drug/metabolite transporter (DMT)-like permease
MPCDNVRRAPYFWFDMLLTDAERTTFTGAYWALAAVTAFSVNDVIIKFLSGDYPLYQVMFLRSTVGLLFVLAVLVPLTGTMAMLKTHKLKTHLLRGLCVVFANFCFFLALAALPLADAVAIFFVSPLLISVFSVVFLGEYVGPRRWAAILLGLVGVLIVVRPGTSAFQIASLLPLLAAVGYAFLHILTRRIGGTENATAMVFYIQGTFLMVSTTAGLVLGHGEFNVFDHPSAVFLFRAWEWPAAFDLSLMVFSGVVTSVGGYMISQAYRRSEAALVAPFEYIALPLSVVFGVVLFAEIPDGAALCGIALILIAGMVLIWREAAARRRATLEGPNRL